MPGLALVSDVRYLKSILLFFTYHASHILFEGRRSIKEQFYELLSRRTIPQFTEGNY
jgi:hypothetical protein